MTVCARSVRKTQRAGSCTVKSYSSMGDFLADAAAGKSAVRVRFHFTGAFGYYWQVDEAGKSAGFGPTGSVGLWLAEGQDGGPVCFRIHRTIGPFEGPDGRVGVDSDEEDVSQPAGGAQIANVADVEEVEAAVRQHDPLSLGPEPIGQLDGLVKSHAARSPA